MFNPFKLTLTLMTSGVFALMLPGSPGAIAQEYPGCFMIDSSGQTRNLNNLCEPPLQTARPGNLAPEQGENVPGTEVRTPGQVQTLPDGSTIQTLPDGTTIQTFPNGTTVTTRTGSNPIQTVPGQAPQGIPTPQQIPGITPTQQQVSPGTSTQQQVSPGTSTQQQVSPGTSTQQQISPGTSPATNPGNFQVNPGVQQQVNPGVQQQISPGVQPQQQAN